MAGTLHPESQLETTLQSFHNHVLELSRPNVFLFYIYRSKFYHKTLQNYRQHCSINCRTLTVRNYFSFNYVSPKSLMSNIVYAFLYCYFFLENEITSSLFLLPLPVFVTFVSNSLSLLLQHLCWWTLFFSIVYTFHIETCSRSDWQVPLAYSIMRSFIISIVVHIGFIFVLLL